MNLVRVGSLGRYLVMAAVLIFPFSVYFLVDNLGVEWLGVILFILLAARLSPLIRANRWAPIVFLVAGGIFLEFADVFLAFGDSHRIGFP